VAAIAQRPTVIWLHFAECTGCTESFLRTINPSIEQVIFDTINLAFHDTLMMASGKRAEEALESAIAKYKGSYILVVEGGIPTKDDGIYLRVGANAETGLHRLKKIYTKFWHVLILWWCAGSIPKPHRSKRRA
jgi:quinone-reactive Ni/Fe-hydrogenase small subunit/[NiFe] hydrogenase small subunit